MQRWIIPGVFEAMTHDLRAWVRLGQGRSAGTHGRDAWATPLASVALRLAHPASERLVRTSPLGRDGRDSRPL